MRKDIVDCIIANRGGTDQTAYVQADMNTLYLLFQCWKM